MDVLIVILTGCAVGWVGYTALNLNESRGRAVSMFLGTAGALIGAKAIAPMFVTEPAAALDLAGLAFAAGTAAALLALGDMVYGRWGV